MAKDRLARFCSGCGELEYYGHPLPYKAKVPAHVSSMGTVEAWYALACSPECLAKVKAGIAKDQADILRLAS